MVPTSLFRVHVGKREAIYHLGRASSRATIISYNFTTSMTIHSTLAAMRNVPDQFQYHAVTVTGKG